MAAPAPTAETRTGTVAGSWEGGAAAFRGIPFAAAPSGDLRFAPPSPAPEWSGVRDVSAPGPIPPQPPSRLEAVVGGVRMPMDEDCLQLNVWTPAADDGARPVLVWLHGGGFSTGSGAFPWYDGAQLATRGDVVVVTMNYRLAAFGFLYLKELADDMGAGNLGLQDMIATLQWVQENIAAFGGDPAQVTVAAQSAGGQSVLAMMSTDHGDGLFQRAILQSSPTGLAPMEPAQAAGIASRYLELLEIEPGDVGELRRRSLKELLPPQGGVAKEFARPLDVRAPFQLTGDDELVAADLVGAAASRSDAGIDVMIGVTESETAAFFALDERVQGLSAEDVTKISARWFGEAAPQAFGAYSGAKPGATPADVAIAMTTDYFFRRNMIKFAEARAERGNPAHVYELEWHPEGSPLGACHCMELPFVFGNLDAMADAPMLAGAERATLEARRDEIQSAWIAFVRSGSPAGDGAAEWPAYDLETRQTMVFGDRPEVVADHAGARRREMWATAMTG